jgi:hypothetical protein
MRLSLVVAAVAAGIALVPMTAARADTPVVRVLPAPPQGPEMAQPPVVMTPRAEVVDDSEDALPTFSHEGRRFVMGTIGERYRIRVVNPTDARVEAVISVDGLDAIDGQTAGLSKRGYIIPAHGDVTIDGWRTSLDSVAAFRFSSVRDSYAARTSTDRNVGVVGVAFFRERPAVVWRPRPWRGAAPNAGAGGPSSASKAAPAPSTAPNATDQRGLGTEFGEEHQSRVTLTSFDRADASPMTMTEVRYDDRAGLLARGIQLPPIRDMRQVELDRRDTAQPFPDMRFARAPR